jgi:hypothetical protein
VTAPTMTKHARSNRLPTLMLLLLGRLALLFMVIAVAAGSPLGARTPPLTSPPRRTRQPCRVAARRHSSSETTPLLERLTAIDGAAGSVAFAVSSPVAVTVAFSLRRHRRGHCVGDDECLSWDHPADGVYSDDLPWGNIAGRDRTRLHLEAQSCQLCLHTGKGPTHQVGCPDLNRRM